MGLSRIIDHYVSLPPNSAPRARGVRYFVPITLYEAYWGAMNSVKAGRRYKKHIVVRRMPYAHGLLQLYTYHFPKTWSAACVANRELIKQAQRQAHALEHAHTSAACVANRELIKQAQRQAHALEHAHTREALEWRVRFFNHYFSVVKGGATPEPGLKPYSRFYQYTYVAIYRQLQAARDKALHPDTDVSFDSIDVRPLQADTIRRSMASSLSRSFAHSPLRSAARRTFRSPSLDESFILRPSAPFSG